jgi:type II secretory pathway pseudopilin PulG
MRPRRRGQAGFSLIEAVVTIGIVSASIVTLVGALANSEKLAGVETRQAQVAVVLRTLADDARSSAVTYHPCDVNSSYKADLQGMAPAGVTVTVTVQRPGSTGLTSTTTNCSPNNFSDFGLQQLTVTVAANSTSGTIVVWKSQATTATAAKGGGGGGGGGGGDGGGGGGEKQ